MKILAVDDNAENVEMISDIMQTLGYDVETAMNGMEALAAVEAEPPDLILLDVNMPQMSGFEVLEHLKASEKNAHIPVILLTAITEVDQRVKGLGLGAEDYLTKPFSARELIARIKTRLRTKAEHDDLRTSQAAIRETFERFVATSVVEKLLEDPASIKLGGQMEEITVMFADLQNFTPIAERTVPEKLLSVLNRYHELVVGTILANGGTVDKFIGDAVMALYNTPLHQVDHALRAVQTAREIQQALPEFYQDIEPELRMKINFGIHTGKAIVGNVGSTQIMQFTAVGDTVNVASRLEDLSHDGQILVSEATYLLVKDMVTAQALGDVPVKGRTVGVTAYAITI